MENMDKIAEKIQNLLNKTVENGCTETEAQTALLLAQKLMAKYNIEQNALAGGEKINYSLEACKVKVNPRSKWMCVIIANSFAVKCVISGNKICYFGREDNAKAAKSALEFAHKVLEKGISDVCHKQGLKSSQAGASLIYNAYAQGFITAMKEALDAQTVALAVVVPGDVKDEFAKKFPVLRKTRARGMKMGYDQREAYEAGREDGSKVMAKRSLEA